MAYSPCREVAFLSLLGGALAVLAFSLACGCSGRV